MELLIDLHVGGHRQGPGSDDSTRRAIGLSGLRGRSGLRIADIGCGTGAATRVLASELDAHVTAVDFLPEFLDVLEREAAAAGLADRITTRAQSMDALDFDEGFFDAIWSEGAIYNMGFEAGVAAWRRFLKPGGVLALSEISWLTATRPKELQAHWDAEYPEIDTASAKIAVLERQGFSPIGYFPLPVSDWLDEYYGPLRARFAEFLSSHGHSEAARAIVDAEEAEIALYETYRDVVGYGFYVARKAGD